MSGEHDRGSPHGGGSQGEPVEGGLTDGGGLPMAGRNDRSFGAGQRDGVAPPDGEAAEPKRGAAPRDDDPGVGDDGGWAGPGTEHSGYGNTPPR